MSSPRQELVRVVRDILAPLIRADGGEIHLVCATDEGVELHLSGHYAGSPGNALATRRIIEPAIWAAVPGARVTVTAGALIPDGAERLDPNPADETPDL